MPKFRPGDLAWMRCTKTDEIPAGEYPIAIIAILPYLLCNQYVYRTDFPPHFPYQAVSALEHRLRPRRDDYQQHEPLSSISVTSWVLTSLHEKDLIDATPA